MNTFWSAPAGASRSKAHSLCALIALLGLACTPLGCGGSDDTPSLPQADSGQEDGPSTEDVAPTPDGSAPDAPADSAEQDALFFDSSPQDVLVPEAGLDGAPEEDALVPDAATDSAPEEDVLVPDAAADSAPEEDVLVPDAALPDASPEDAPVEAALPEASEPEAEASAPEDAGPSQQDCVDIQVSPGLLGDAARWESEPSMSLSGASETLWVWENQLFAAWTANERVGTSSRRRLIISAFDSRTGQYQSSAVLQSYLPTGSELLFYQVAPSPDGRYALLVRHRGYSETYFKQMLVLGRSDGSSETVWSEMPEDSRTISYNDVAWDGKAFVLHAWQPNAAGATTDLKMLRLNPDGSVLQPLTTLIATPNSAAGTFPPSATFAISDETGHAVVNWADASGTAVFAMHDKDGAAVAPFSHVEWSTQSILPQAIFLSTGPTQLLLRSWSPGQGVKLRPVAYNLNYLSESLTVPPEPTSNPSMTYSVYATKALYASNAWWTAFAKHRSIDVMRWPMPNNPEMIPVLVYQTAPCPTGSCSTDVLPWTLGTRIVHHRGNLWIGVWDRIPTGASSFSSFYRAMRVSPGCTYQSQTVVNEL